MRIGALCAAAAMALTGLTTAAPATAQPEVTARKAAPAITVSVAGSNVPQGGTVSFPYGTTPALNITMTSANGGPAQGTISVGMGSSWALYNQPLDANGHFATTIPVIPAGQPIFNIGFQPSASSTDSAVIHAKWANGDIQALKPAVSVTAPDTAIYGESVEATVKVVFPQALSPQGTVKIDFFDYTSGPLSLAADGTASWTLPKAGAGARKIQVNYDRGNNVNLAFTEASRPITITKDTTTTKATLAFKKATKMVRARVTVVPAHGMPMKGA